MPRGPEQLPLAIGIAPQPSFDNFVVAPSNAQCVAAVRELAAGVGESPVLVWAAPGQGLTHLARAAVAPADYIDLSGAEAATLAGLAAANRRCLALDNVDVIGATTALQQAVFHLFNRVQHAGGKLLFTAHTAPAGLSQLLPDLRSRLLSGLVYQLHPLGDGEKLAAMQLRARERGFELPDEVGQYLMHHVPRSLGQLMRLVDLIDFATLSAHKRATIPFVKQLLAGARADERRDG